MTEALAERPSLRAATLGGILCVFALCSGVAAVVLTSKLSAAASSSWLRGVAIQAALSAVWLAWSGVKLVRRSPWSTFRLPGNLALAAGAAGIFVNLRYAFAREYFPYAIQIAQSLCILGAVAFVAGLGHRAAAKGSAFAPMLHALAVLGPLTVIALVTYGYLANPGH